MSEVMNVGVMNVGQSCQLGMSLEMLCRRTYQIERLSSRGLRREQDR